MNFINSNNEYYKKLLKLNEELSSMSVGWNLKKQQLLFHQFLQLFQNEKYFSINDIGCGNGAFFKFLYDNKLKFEYHGYDISESFIDICLKNYNNKTDVNFHHIHSLNQIQKSDFSIASGLLNMPFLDEDEWRKYGFELIDNLSNNSEKGYSFNALSDKCPVEKRKKGLYFWNSAELYEYCLNKHSDRIILLHDYYPYDFTIIVRK